jgi:hypothetical protein
MQLTYFLFALAAYLAVLYVSEFAVENQIYRMVHQKPLFDRGHNLFPVVPNLYANIVLIGLMVYFVARAAFQNNISILTNYMCMLVVLFLGRIVLLFVTQLPPPVPDCSTVKDGDPLHFVLLKSDWKECMDLMYSGHTLHSTLIFMFILYISKYPLEQFAIGMLVLVEYYLIIASRMHYTADVVVAVIVSILAFLSWSDISGLHKLWYYGGLYGRALRENN